MEVYCSFPLKPVADQTFNDGFITGEIVRMLMGQEQYEHPQLGPSLVAYAKVMGLSESGSGECREMLFLIRRS